MNICTRIFWLPLVVIGTALTPSLSPAQTDPAERARTLLSIRTRLLDEVPSLQP